MSKQESYLYSISHETINYKNFDVYTIKIPVDGTTTGVELFGEFTLNQTEHAPHGQFVTKTLMQIGVGGEELILKLEQSANEATYHPYSYRETKFSPSYVGKNVFFIIKHWNHNMSVTNFKMGATRFYN